MNDHALSPPDAVPSARAAGLRVSVGELLWVREYLPERHSGNPYHRTQLRQRNAPVDLGDLL